VRLDLTLDPQLFAAAAAAADVLAEPSGRLLFAGEAASSKPATVLGAYLSGKREAERLLQLLQQQGGTTGGAVGGDSSGTIVNATGGPL
jgi:hypothetical protein